jgi:hypothetical protein
MGWVGQAQGIRWGCESGLKKVPPPLPVSHHPPPFLCTRLQVFVFLSSLLGGVAAGLSPHLMWLEALDVCWALSMDFLNYAGIPAVSRGQHHCVGTHLFVSPPPLLGAELGNECGSCRFCKFSCLHQGLAADLKLPWTEMPDKLVVGIT